MARRISTWLADRSPPSWPTGRQWVLFALQIVLVAMVQLSNDIIRGNIARPSAEEAIEHAHDVIAFERQHGFFVEPGIQMWLQHAQHVLWGTITWSLATSVADFVYAFGHIFVTLGVAIWVFLWHRRYFPVLRDVTLLTGALAFVGYEAYSLAPPRLTPAITYNGHPFAFQDTMRHVIGTGTLNGTPIAYNPFSAMPSLHVAWALIVGTTVVLLARSWIVRLPGALYPFAMTAAIVITANHYFMDALGALGAVCIAALVIVPAEWRLRRLGRGGDQIAAPASAESSCRPPGAHAAQ